MQVVSGCGWLQWAEGPMVTASPSPSQGSLWADGFLGCEVNTKQSPGDPHHAPGPDAGQRSHGVISVNSHPVSFAASAPVLCPDCFNMDVWLQKENTLAAPTQVQATWQADSH